MGPIDINALSMPDHNWLLDYVSPGAPLIITFGFYNSASPAQYNFYGRLKKLEVISGRPLNKLLLRDPSYLWYLRGIKGLGEDLENTIAAIRRIIDDVNPSQIVTMGQSMGVYGALLYGILLDVPRMITFGQISCFNKRLWNIIGENRWEPILEQLLQGAPIAPYDDLVELLRTSKSKAEIDMIYGNFAGKGASVHEAVAIDAAHAIRFAEFDNIHLFPVAEALHPVAQYFHRLGTLDALFMQRLFGTPFTKTKEELRTIPNHWVKWVEENMALGIASENLQQILQEHGFNQEVAELMIDKAKILTVLNQFEELPPQFLLP
jgi:hypothetical protein